MPVIITTKVQGVEPLVARFEKHPRKVAQLVYTNWLALGKRLSYIMRRELSQMHYTGETEASVSSEINGLTLTVGPTSKHAIFQRTGTRPHWVPIEPLKRWAYWKLGDEKAAYAVQWNIKRFGTSRSLAQKGIRGAEQTQYGIGFNFPRTTLERGDAQTAITNTARRLGLQLVASIAGEE